ncbi:aromatic ring-hydroxylating dioxygenase subunit alpha [Komagataeibacter rhaeticus]|nr:aromatic ring-hydroxylating dioxygenase subunit alpha [Komagataeibacter rhaeticus]
MAESLPLCYVDKSFYEFEKKAIFDHEWLCVGRESWLDEAGEYFTTTIVGEPILVTRGRDGVLRAMSSVCQHRGMLVAEGHGRKRSFVCPYHHWTYGLDGQLVAAPAMEKPADLTRHPRHSLLFRSRYGKGSSSSISTRMPPLAPRLGAVSEVVRNYRLAEAEGPRPGEPLHYPWNWKVMFENNNDGYHANKLHHGVLHDFVPSELAAFPTLPEDTAGYYRTNGTLHADASFNATQKAVLPLFPDLDMAGRSQMVLPICRPPCRLS